MANKGSSSTNSSGWLSNFLRPKGSGVTIESCLNLNNLNSHTPLDARPIIPLLESSQSIVTRTRLIKEFSVLCQRYSFTHLENVFFTIQNNMQPTAPKECRHVVFEFMAACIDSQYESLGMARVTFYNALKEHTVYDDLKDMYSVLSKLIKDGRDITSFEKNITKLLISWLDMALSHSPVDKVGDKSGVMTSTVSSSSINRAADGSVNANTHTTSPRHSEHFATKHLEQIVRLITAIMKFNFAMFEEGEVTEVILAIKRCFWTIQDAADQKACLEFADVIIPYGFVPMDGLQAFLDLLCRAAIVTDPTSPSYQHATFATSIFKNLLRSHCAHSAVLALCKSMTMPLTSGSSEELIAFGALILLSQAAWSAESRGSNYGSVTSSTVLLSYMRRALRQKNALINVQIFKSLLLCVQNHTIITTDWDIFWDICREYSQSILDDVSEEDIAEAAAATKPIHSDDTTHHVKYLSTEHLSTSSQSSVIQQFFALLQHIKLLQDNNNYKGPLDSYMDILHLMRQYLPEDVALSLLTYYESEHLLMPSSATWLSLLEETTYTFFISPTSSRTVRLRMLDIILNICDATYDFYLNDLVSSIIIPIAGVVQTNRDKDVIDKTVSLIVKVATDCNDYAAFQSLVSALDTCSKCKCLGQPRSMRHTESQPSQQTLSERKRSVSQMARRSSKHHTQERIPRPTASHSLSTSSDAKAKQSDLPNSSSQMPYCLGVASANGLVQLFDQLLQGSDPKYCLLVFDCLLSIARDHEDDNVIHDSCRIIALDVLLRLRCRPDHHIYLSTSLEASTQYSFALGDRSILSSDSSGTRLPQESTKNSLIRKSTEHTPPSQESSANAAARKDSQRERVQVREIKGLGITHSDPAYTDPDFTMYNERPSRIIVSYSPKDISEEATIGILPASELLRCYLDIITKDSNWNTVSFLMESLPAQMSNKHLFCGATEVLQQVRGTMCELITKHTFLENVTNLPSNIKRNDLSILAYNVLTVMISYRRIFNKNKQDELVFCFYFGIMQITSATKACINALTVCCHELPLSISKMLNEILMKMSQIISHSSVSVHILEFLSGLARLPNLYANFTGDMYKPVFAIALKYIQYSHSLTNPQHSPSIKSPNVTPSTSSGHLNEANTPGSSNNTQPFQSAFAQYLLIMAYQVITVWFIAVPLRERRRHVAYIVKGLLSANSATQTIDEQTLTCIDMLSRFSFANADLAPKKSVVSDILMNSSPDSSGSNGPSSTKKMSKTWSQGNTLFTLTSASATGWVEATIRRPSGTVSVMCKIENDIRRNDIDTLTLPAFLMMHYNPDGGLGLTDLVQLSDHEIGNRDGMTTQPTNESSTKTDMSKATEHEVKPTDEAKSPDVKSANSIQDILVPPTTADKGSSTMSRLRKDEYAFDPSFLYLQFGNYADLAHLREISPPLPDDDTLQRALDMFDKVPVVNFHKIGVVYVGPGQSHEIEILANQYGSPDYVTFLNGLGTIQRLKGRKSNTGGLDREMDIDGKYAYFWNDETTEIVFHAATLMPTNLERDGQCSLKKRHIGNDFVHIVYNDSGKDYAFDTLPGQFNFINIVVSPHSEDSSKVILSSRDELLGPTASAANALGAGQHPDPYTTSTGTDNTFFKVIMQRRANMSEIGPMAEFKMVSAQTLPGFIRQMALHANIFSQVFLESGGGGRHEYVSHWVERLRQIRRIKERQPGANNDMSAVKTSKDGIMALESMLDFTRYT
ncbi:hypothetical protein BC943DRAFT_348621 [Umbelopsis sp. AD052]|nr:hypothetical protein BC943DRAFT_348621 [Umbelopsis sp. AD052]